MRKLERAGLAVLVAVAFLLSAWWAFAPHRPFRAPPQDGATVKVMLSDRHGSAVHIGNGLFLTAAHVVNGSDPLTLKTDRGRTLAAERLWVNVDRDVALLRAAGLDGIAAAALACRTPAIGEEVAAAGNPGDDEFVHSFGRVSSRAEKRGPWLSVVVMDLTVVPGMSGGPVIDAAGEVVGIAVAVQTFGFAFARLGYVVPGTAICPLLGRS